MPDNPASHRSRWQGVLHFAAGILFSALFLYLAVRNIPAAHIWREIEHANVPLLVAGVGLVMVSNVVRALRWMALFGGAEGVRFRPVFGSMAVGYLANNVLPARLGEIIRIYLVERTTGVDVGLATATVVVERLAEAFMLLIAVLGLSGFVQLPRTLRSVLPAAAGILLCVAALLAILAFRPVRDVVLRVIDKDTGRIKLPQSWHSAITRAAAQFITGVRIVREPSLAAKVAVMSVVIWAIEAAVAWVVGLALNAPLGVVGSMLLYTVVSVSFVVPAAPGGVGSYEYFGTLALADFGLGAGVAFSVALVLHVVQYGASVALGIIGVWIEEGLSFRDLLPRRSKEHI